MKLLRGALVLFVLMTVLTGVVYPFAVTAIGQTLFSNTANGSPIKDGDKLIGSRLIGQAFSSKQYFWGRPSATATPYDAAASGGSNLGPLNPALRTAVAERVAAMRTAHPDQTGLVPVELVTTSASGIDPHISPAAALYQVQRVAKARGMTLESVNTLIQQHTEGRFLGIVGEPVINVLELNLALDAISAGK